MEAGKVWAYRKRAIDPLEPVTYIKHRQKSAKKPKYSWIRFESPDAEGLEEWVPDGRLKCPWADAEAFIARERRWAEVSGASIVSEDIDRAVDATLDALVPSEVMGSCARSGGISPYEIADVSALSRLCGIPEEDLTSAPTAFKEGDRVIVPFETAARVARALAAQHPDIVLRAVEREERDFEEQQDDWRQHGSPPKGKQSEDWDEARRRSFQIRREWVGAETQVFSAELRAARMEVQRMRELVESAAKMLKANGHTTSAARLRKYLDSNGKPD